MPRVLVVEDSKTQAQQIRLLLEDASFDAVVELVEQLGSEVVLDIKVDRIGLTLSGIEAEKGICAGEAVRVSVITERMHFFDPATEQALC